MEHYARTRVGEGICNAHCDQRLVLANEDRATGQAGATIVVSLGAAKSQLPEAAAASGTPGRRSILNSQSVTGAACTKAYHVETRPSLMSSGRALAVFFHSLCGALSQLVIGPS